MTVFDATVFPNPRLPNTRRLRFIAASGSTPDAVPVIGGDGKQLPAWFDRVNGTWNEAVLNELLAHIADIDPGSEVCLNVESHFYPTRRYNGSNAVADVSPFIKLHLDVARLARGHGLKIVSPFEALQEAESPAIESDRYVKSGFLNHQLIGLDKLTSINNDELQAVFDTSDMILARCYASDRLSPAQVKTITRRNIGEAYRVGRGKPIIAITRPDTLSDGDMAAQIAEVEAQRVSIAYWLDMYADQSSAIKMLNMSTTTATRQD